MDINFESQFLTSLSKYKIKDKYYDEYLKTTRYHKLIYDSLYNQYNNDFINNKTDNNKYTYVHVDESNKENLLSNMKNLIIRQKKIYNNLLHHYRTTNPELLFNDKTDTMSINSSHSTKSTKSTKSIISTKSTKIYRVERKDIDTSSLKETDKPKKKFSFFTKKIKESLN